VGSENWAKAFRYVTLSMEIPIMALVGYIVGRGLDGLEVYGMVLGAILGVFLLWFNLYRVFKESKQRKV